MTNNQTKTWTWRRLPIGDERVLTDEQGLGLFWAIDRQRLKQVGPLVAASPLLRDALHQLLHLLEDGAFHADREEEVSAALAAARTALKAAQPQEASP